MINVEDIRHIIMDKIEDYQKIIQDLESNKQNQRVRETLSKYQDYVVCLSDLNRQLFDLTRFQDHAIFEALRENYEKYDTEFIFLDGTSHIVKKDDICSFQDNCIMVHNKEKFKEDPTIMGPIDKIINLDNVKMIEKVF